MNIQLPTGKTISISVYEFFFLLKEEDIDGFYQSCMADDLGQHIESPFSNRAFQGRLELPDVPEIEETGENFEED